MPASAKADFSCHPSTERLRNPPYGSFRSQGPLYRPQIPAPPNYPVRDPKYHLIETIGLFIEVHWGV